MQDILINTQDNLISYSTFPGPSALKLNHCFVNTCITGVQQISPIPGHTLSVPSWKIISEAVSGLEGMSYLSKVRTDASHNDNHNGVQVEVTDDTAMRLTRQAMHEERKL